MKAVYVNVAILSIFVALIISSFFINFPQKAPVPERLLIMFVLIALSGFELVHRAFLHSRRRNHFFYALTTKRVLVLDVSISRIVSDLDLRTVDYPRATSVSDGVGTITFGSPPLAINFWNAGRQNGDEFLEGIGVKKGPPSLKLVDNVDDVLKDVLLARIAAMQLELTSENPSSPLVK